MVALVMKLVDKKKMNGNISKNRRKNVKSASEAKDIGKS